MEFDRETQLSLDPADWEAFRRLSHRMVDDTIDHLRTLREQPVWREMPGETLAALHEPLPVRGVGEDEVYDQFLRHVRDYTNGNRHPRFWGWVQGNGTPLAMMAEMLAAAINPHMAGFNQAPALVEKQVLRWLAELMGMPEASGVLVTGGTAANLLGLAVGLHAKAGFDVGQEGLRKKAGLTAYASREIHAWARKAVSLLGLGRDSLRLVEADAQGRIRVDSLRERLERDRNAGERPFCVVGTAGTIDTGAVDDLERLSELCRGLDLWFHVDGAIGAMARLSERLHPLVSGLERADSLAFDLHKWGYLPFSAACLLVRDGDAHRRAFSLPADYLAPLERGVIAGGLPFSHLGIDLTRNFKALKIWMSFKAHGTEAIGRVIEQNVRQAHYLARLVQDHPELELMQAPSLNVVCFRWAPSGFGADTLDEANAEILMRLQERGIAVPSSTRRRGRFALRVAIVNHRSRFEDFDALIEAVVAIGDELKG